MFVSAPKVYVDVHFVSSIQPCYLLDVNVVADMDHCHITIRYLLYFTFFSEKDANVANYAT